MRSVRPLVVVAATILAISLMVPSASAASPKAFHLSKTCVSDVLCTIVTDTFGAIPGGTDVTYTYDNSDPWDGLAYPTIQVRNGSTTGVCDWFHSTAPVLARCTFAAGTGRLTQFKLVVDVTFDGTTWFWDGWYWFGG